MAESSHSEMNFGQYDCSLEELSSRNASIIKLFVLGIASTVLMFGIFQVQWFFEEGIHALQNVEMQVDPVCVSAGGTDETCMRSGGGGPVWWLLLGTFLASLGIAPLAAMALKITYRTKGVTQEWQNTTNGLLLFGLPSTVIWALLWLVCLPVAWTLLPWGDWSVNWWKIFPYGFGLIWVGGLPLLLVFRKLVKMVFSPEYTHDKKSAESESEAEPVEKEVEAEGEEESSSTSSEPTDSFAAHREERSANVADAESNKRPAITALVIGIILFIIGLPLFIGSGQENLGMLIPGAIAFGIGAVLAGGAMLVLISSWVTSYAKTGKPAPWWTKIAPVFGILLLIPGVVLLIVGGVAAGNFEHYGVSTATLEIEDIDMLGDQGFIIYVKGTPGDKNGNGIHDYCENIIVNATHSGDWMSSPWNADSTPSAADETRDVFELEISHEGSGCDAQHWPKEKWKNDTQLVKIGRACYGCMAGSTTISAEYESSDGINPPASMWIQDGEVLVGSTVMTIFGSIFAGTGTLTFVCVIVIILKLKEAAKKDLVEEKEPIEIIGRAAPNQPIHFRINRTRWRRDAWVGLYHRNTADQYHGGRWSWLRDIDVNNATLPGQPVGQWSIRVFKDGGYNLEHRLDFEIHSSPQQLSTTTSPEGLVEGKVAFKSVHGKYLSAQPDGRAEWNRDRADVWEYFHLEKREGGKIALKGAHGMYVSAQADGSVQINRREAPPGGWEEFTVEHQFTQPVGRRSYDVVRLKSVHNKYLSAQSDGRAEWNRDQAPEGGWEDLEMEYQGEKTHPDAERLHQSQACEIHIVEATEGKPIRFNVNNRPSGNEAWFGLYPEKATDHEHGEQHQNWMYFRDVGENELSLPAKSAGRWSIRVFSDGGFNMMKRLDFAIVDHKSSDSAKKIQSVFKEPAAYRRSSDTMPSSVTVSGAGSSEVNGTYVFKPGEHENRHWGNIAGHYQHTKNHEMFIAFQDCGAGHNRPDWNKWMIISKIGVLYAAHTGGKTGVPPRDGGWETVDSWGNPGAPGGQHPAPTVRHGESAFKGSSGEKKTNFWDSIK